MPVNTAGPTSVIVSTNDSYAYPFSNATNGGQLNSEKNLRNALLNILSYSGAFSTDHFNVTVNGYENSSYNINVGTGRGNCNAYFAKITNALSNIIIPFDITTYDDAYYNGTTHFPNNSQLRLGLYLCVDYASNIATDLSLKLVVNGVKVSGDTEFNESDTTLSRMIGNEQTPGTYFGFNDIGIYLGHFLISKDSSGNITYGTSFVKNPNITKCIDISKLGSEDGLSKTLEELIRRLWKLNIYSGDFYISDTVVTETQGSTTIEKDIGTAGAIEKYGGDYRLRMHIENTEVDTNVYQINGNLIFASFDENDLVVGSPTQICTFSTSQFNPTTQPPQVPQLSSITFTIPLVLSNNVTVSSVTLNGVQISSSSENILDITGTSSPTIHVSYENDTTEITPTLVRANTVYGAVWN